VLTYLQTLSVRRHHDDAPGQRRLDGITEPCLVRRGGDACAWVARIVGGSGERSHDVRDCLADRWPVILAVAGATRLMPRVRRVAVDGDQLTAVGCDALDRGTGNAGTDDKPDIAGFEWVLERQRCHIANTRTGAWIAALVAASTTDTPINSASLSL